MALLVWWLGVSTFKSTIALPRFKPSSSVQAWQIGWEVRDPQREQVSSQASGSVNANSLNSDETYFERHEWASNDLWKPPVTRQHLLLLFYRAASVKQPSPLQSKSESGVTYVNLMAQILKNGWQLTISTMALGLIASRSLTRARACPRYAVGL